MPKLPVRVVALASLAALSSLAACGDGGGGPSEGDGPRITSIAPNEVLPNSGRVLLFVRGTDFGTGAHIEWNGTAQETEEFSRRQALQLPLPRPAATRMPGRTGGRAHLRRMH